MLTARAQPRKARPLGTRDRAALILAAVDDLPFLPPIPVGLIDAEDPAESGTITEIFEHHELWLAALRRLARETECSAAAPTMSARELVTQLGAATARDAALALQYPCALGSPSGCHDACAHLDRLRLHSVAVACACRMLCEHAPHLGDAATAFACGLVHDIGKFALISCCPRSYVRVCRRVREQQVSLVEAERDALGIDHAVVGGHVGVRLAFSAQMVDGIRLHHQPLAQRRDLATQVLPALVHMADRIVHDDDGVAPTRPSVCDLDEIAAALDVETGVLKWAAQELPNRVRPFAAMFDAIPGDPESHLGHTFAAVPSRSKLVHRESLTVIDADQAVVRAIRRFTELLGTSAHAATPRRHCEAAAACVRDALSVDSCVAVLGSSASQVLFLGAASGKSGASVALRSRAVPALSVTISNVVEKDRPDCAFTPAPEACDLIWESCLDTIPHGTLWLLPFVLPSATREADVRGGVLVSTGGRSNALPAMDMAGWDVLATVMGLAAVGAIARGERETHADLPPDDVRQSHELLNEQVHERMISAVAAMAGGAAHELNNPLSVISGRVQLLLGDCKDEATAKTLREIKDQAHCASRIVTDLMSFARPEPPRPETFKLGGFLVPLFQRWKRSFEADGPRLELRMADRNATAYADVGQMGEVLEAVVANATAATRENSKPVEINLPSRASDETVRIVVTDHGVGMTRDVLAHAFDPFFSFRESGRGRGMGLSRAYRLAEINGGRLRLESRVDSGTTVTIEFPSRPSGA